MDNFEHLVIDTFDLIEALEATPNERCWVLNLETGEVMTTDDEERGLDEEEDGSVFDDLDRFMGIQPISSRDAFQIMEAFVEGLPDSAGQRSLVKALGYSRPFRAFKDALLDFHPLREAWFKFQNDQMLMQAQQWVDEHVPGARLKNE